MVAERAQDLLRALLEEAISERLKELGPLMVKVARAISQECVQQRTVDEKEVGSSECALERNKEHVDMFTRATATLERGVVGSILLQSCVGSSVRQVVQCSQIVSSADRSRVLSFLSGGDEIVAFLHAGRSLAFFLSR